MANLNKKLAVKRSKPKTAPIVQVTASGVKSPRAKRAVGRPSQRGKRRQFHGSAWH